MMQRFPIYVKKAELSSYVEGLKKQVKIWNATILISIIVVQSILFYTVLPKMALVFDDIGGDLNLMAPYYARIALIISIIIGFFVIVLSQLMHPLDIDKIKLLKRQNTNLLTINSSLNNKAVSLIVGAYCLAVVACIIVFLILPIYNLSSSI